MLGLPSPERNDWSQVDICLELERILDDAVPDVVELTCCRTNSCSCRRANLTCTEACLCGDDDKCENLLQFDTNLSNHEED